MYVGTKLGGKETQPDVIHFITILPLKVLGCFEITLLHVHRPPMVLYRFKINKDQIWQELLSTLAYLYDCWSTKQDLILLRPFQKQQVISHWEPCVDDICGYWKVIYGSYSVIHEGTFCCNDLVDISSKKGNYVFECCTAGVLKWKQEQYEEDQHEILPLLFQIDISISFFVKNLIYVLIF